MKKPKKTYKEQFVGTTKPKRRNRSLYISICLVCGYMGHVFTAAAQEGFTNFSQNLLRILRNPFKGYSNTILGVFCGVVIGLLISAYHFFTKKKIAPGYEQGDEEWGNVSRLCKRLQDPKPQNNRILTEHLEMSIDASITDLNNNMLVIGSPGSRKSFGLIRPNLLRCCGSMVVTDPKGELLKQTGEYLIKNGYELQVLNLIDMEHSDFYNPFEFIRSIDDIPKLLNVFFENTEDPQAQKGEPFWRAAELMFDQAIMTYVYMEEDFATFPRVVDMINQAKIATDSRGNLMPSELDRIFMELPKEHPAKVLYEKAMTGAADTIRSIIITAQARLNLFSNRRLCKMMQQNTINLAGLGEGIGEEKKKTALFLVIPDADTTYNAIAAMLYTQLVQELYRVADSKDNGRLPIPVTMWLDEFANISMPKNFLSYLSTMRGRLISAVIVVQGIAQLRDKYKDLWESVANCCDTIIFLGGSGLETNKWISEELGKVTYDKITHGISRGSHGSSSSNYDVYGRELMAPAELRRMPRDKAIVIIAGEYAIYDDKYMTQNKPEFKASVAMGVYKHSSQTEKNKPELQQTRTTTRMKQLIEKLKEEDMQLSRAREEALCAYAKENAIPVVHVKTKMETIQETADIYLRQFFDNYTEEQFALIREGKLGGLGVRQLQSMLRPEFSVGKIRIIIQAELNRKRPDNK